MKQRGRHDSRGTCGPAHLRGYPSEHGMRLSRSTRRPALRPTRSRT